MSEDKLEDIIFSWTSVFIHTAIFIVWFLSDANVNLLTNIVSLEAIYITLLIGLGQRKKHQKTKEHLETIKHHVKKGNYEH